MRHRQPGRPSRPMVSVPRVRPVATGIALTSLLLWQAPAVASAPTTVADLGTALCGGATVALSAAIDEDTKTLSITAACTATLDLNGQDLTVSRVELGAGSNLTIRDTSGGAAGQLLAKGSEDNAAGIQTTGATLRIHSGIVTASGGRHGAGIGGSEGEAGGTVIISGGTVTASASSGTSSGSSAAGIGGGRDGAAGTITISGGTVTATGHLVDGYYGAGIGSGDEAPDGGSITISGGTVTATGADYGAGIGGGYASVGDTITISGGSVTATGGDYGAGIGTGQSAEGTATITISGGTVTATGGEDAGAGIGGGDGVSGGDITVSGGSVTAGGGAGAAGIGGGYEGDGGTITVAGGTVTATGGSGGAGVGGGNSNLARTRFDFSTTPPTIVPDPLTTSGGTISVTGGSVTATSGFDADWFGIGGGEDGVEGTVTIGPGITRVDSGRVTTLTSDGSSGTGGTTTTSASGPVLTGSGAPPALTPGVGVWQDESGTETPLTVSSPGSGQVRYSAPGLQVTLTGSSRSSTGSGLVADRDGVVECELCAFLAEGGVVESWVFSEPRLVAAWRVEELEALVGDLPCQRFTIPVGTPLDGGDPLPAGVHTLQLQLPTVNGIQAVNVGVTVTGPLPVSIPAGEGWLPGDVDRSIPAGLAALLFGPVLAAGAIRRRRAATTS